MVGSELFFETTDIVNNFILLVERINPLCCPLGVQAV